MYRFAFLALVAAVFANTNVRSKCPDVKTVDNFNWSTYGKGTWYEIARYPNRSEKGAECGWAEYTPNGEVAKVKNYHFLNNKIKVVEGTHRPQGSGKVTANLPYGAGGSSVDLTLNILTYNNDYLVGYLCRETKDGYQELSWVLSRSKVLSADDKAAVDKFLKESKVVDSTKYVWPSFSETDCRIDV